MILSSKFIFFTFVFLIITACKNQELTEMKLSDELLEPLQTESTDVGNGGDLIRCFQSSPKFMHLHAKDGWYTLDYSELDKINADFFEFSGLDPLIVVRDRLNDFAPELVGSFESFLASIEFASVSLENLPAEPAFIKREWIAVESNEDVADESQFVVPTNCIDPKTRNVILHQVVVRKEVFNPDGELVSVRYYYDPILFDKLQKNPFQISMLLVHEWLWDLFSDNQSKRLRIANRLLHAKKVYPKDFMRKALLLKSVK